MHIASALSRQATFLLDHNQVQEAMGLSLEARNLVTGQQNVSLRQSNIIRDAFALTLVSQDQWDAALVVALNKTNINLRPVS